MNRLHISQLVIVEGKYDAVAVAGLLDALILPTDGFSIFSDIEKKALIQKLGRQRGLLVLTDSDAAGFRIRHYIEKIALGCEVLHAYIPALPGKESRKSVPSKEGTLGVEGMDVETLRTALLRAGVGQAAPVAAAKAAITYTDLYELGLSGGRGSAGRRRLFLQSQHLPQRLSKRALVQVLSSLYTREELETLMDQKPVLFWDFHGTLTLPDVSWYDAAMDVAAATFPQKPLTWEMLLQHLKGQRLPWWSVPDRDTRHLTPPGAWWAHCETEFVQMFCDCGFSQAEAETLAPKLRGEVLQPRRYQLYPDALSTMQTLQHRGYRQFLLSNNYPELEELAGALGLLPYLEGVVVSACVGFDKPRREIFDHARNLAGNPMNCWMVGDNPTDDIEGAKKAGFTTVFAHVDGRDIPPVADHSIENLTELLTLLE